MALKGIGTGCGGTGTNSMRRALNILAVGPTHPIYEHGERSPVRKPGSNGSVGGSEPDWDILFHGCNIGVDWPSAYY